MPWGGHARRDGEAATRPASRWDFFISYTAADQIWAEWIAWQLESAGLRVLVQAWDFIPGSNWMTGMQQGVQESDRTIAVLSEDYLQSVYGQAEWQAALSADPQGLASRLVPIRITECPRPGLLGQIVSFDLFGLSEAAAAARLIEQVEVLRAGRAKPAAKPSFPGQAGRADAVRPVPAKAPPAVAAPTAPRSSRPVQRAVLMAAAPRARLAHGVATPAVTWSPDGLWLATGSTDRALAVWHMKDPASPALQARVAGHRSAVRAVAWSPDGRWLATGSNDRTLGIWDMTNRAAPSQRARLHHHSHAVLDVTWSPDGQWLATGSTDRTVNVWAIAPDGRGTVRARLTRNQERLVVSSYDVTARLVEGRNAVGVILGQGWAVGRLTWEKDKRGLWADCPAGFVQLDLDYGDRQETVTSDATWRAATGAILADGIYDGEEYDARREPAGWSEPGFDETGWSPVEVVDWDTGTLTTSSAPPIQRIEELPAIEVLHTPSGRAVVDFGQNLSGWVRLTVTGPAGTTITLRHAEALIAGEPDFSTNRTALATDRYILRGGGPGTWEPRFTFHGFRYVEVNGWPGTLKPADLTAVVVHSDMRRIGWFETSHAQRSTQTETGLKHTEHSLGSCRKIPDGHGRQDLKPGFDTPPVAVLAIWAGWE